MFVLPTPPSAMEGFGAIDINDRGEVLGMMSFAWSPTVSFVWSAGSGYRIFGPAAGDVVGGAINNKGDVVGLYVHQYGHAPAPLFAYEGFIWNAERGYQKIQLSTEYQLARLTDISDAGEIVGLASDAPPPGEPVLGAPRLLKWSSRASNPIELGINESGAIAGSVRWYGSNTSQAVVWSGETVKTIPAISGVLSTSARDVDGAGRVLVHAR
jgi:uncharacterized membrane protein